MPKAKPDTTNEFLWSAGKNMDNSTHAQRGRANYVIAQRDITEFRTKQQAFRMAAWLVEIADSYLPDEDVPHTFEEIRTAIRNT